MNESLFGKSEADAPETPEKTRKLTQEELFTKLRDPSYLPSYEEITENLYLRPLAVRLEKWMDFMRKDEKQWLFEIWTKEYISDLGNYLEKRAEELGGTEKKPLVILEVGAGNGRLTHFLKEYIEKSDFKDKIKIVACDFDDAEKWKIQPDFPVENIPHDKALEKYKPRIVICSWMAPKEDFTFEFRASEGLMEYVLIGDPEVCGKPWETYGEDYTYAEDGVKKIPPYQKDGFEEVRHSELKGLSHQSITGGRDQTTTISFIRKPVAPE